MPLYGDLVDDPQRREEEVLSFWDEEEIFEESVKQNRENQNWVFYEGPPTANGRPHFGHLMARVYKDLFPRFKTMQGYCVERKGGWDTHGLPVELEVEKDLGLDSKEEIEDYGIEEFIEKCKESVWEYKQEWERMMDRMGFWIDLENPYITYEDDYIESLWWELKEIWKEGLLYKGHKVLPYCPRCGTGLSSHEVAQGYRMTEDPSIFVKFPLEGEKDTYLLAWTTTPWTIPSNTALAVSRNFLYGKVEVEGDYLIMAKALLDKVLGPDYSLVEEIEGEELVGSSYTPPYGLVDDENAYQVHDAPFVSLEEGTGIVHIAPAFGEEDSQLGEQKGLPFFRPLDMEGHFTEDFPLAQGEFVKDADEEIVEDLRERGFLLKSDSYEHEYPFCWRCDTPLLYFALDSWYIATTERKEEILANNERINWYPAHMKEGRFGDFLENLKDWALSRDRYWGTPLNVWQCEECGERLAVGSREELVERAEDEQAARDVELHRPFVDEIKLRCPDCHGSMKRVPHVIDTWFDSGSMHTAQWHYPFENEDKFKNSFPADFICEGQDQTRGWFYTLLVTSTLLYGERAFKNVVVTGYGLDAEGNAMSKSKGNVIDPWEIIGKYGADAVRWYLFSSTAPWKTRRLEEEGPGEVLYKFLNTVENTYNFFSLYANIDGFRPGSGEVLSEGDLSLLDRWIRSRLNGTIERVTGSLEDYDITTATEAIENFVDDLSNWYVRCSRDRFWSSDSSLDKRAAYSTLYQSLIGTVKLLAPFVPFLAEDIYSNLRREEDPRSVHLSQWPQAGEEGRDKDLEREMEEVRSLTALGRKARNKVQIKVRQPLSRVILREKERALGIGDEAEGLLKEELNVKAVQREEELDQYYRPFVEPDFSSLGPQFGSQAQSIGDQISELDGRTIMDSIEDQGYFELEIDGESFRIGQDHLEVERRPPEELVKVEDERYVLLLDLSMNEELKNEGYVRELIRRIQQLRKEAGFQVTDRIQLFCRPDRGLRSALEKHSQYLKSEVLADELILDQLPEEVEISSTEKIDGAKVIVGLRRKG